jgi:hypothetical protein
MSETPEKQVMNLSNRVEHESHNITENVDFNKLYKMAFIYNALMDGWTIRKVNNNKLEFSKDKETVKEFELETFLSKFIEKNLDVSSVLSNFECV